MNKKIMIVYLGILAAMAPLATDMYLPALPELQAEFGSTTSMTQLTLTMTMMGMAVGQIFATLAGIGMVMAAATLVYRETLPVDNRIKSVGATLRVLPQLMKNRYFMGHCLVQSFIFMSFFSYIGSSSFIFQGIYGVSAQEYSLIFGGIGVGMLLLGPIPAKLAGKVSEASMLCAAMTVQLAGSICLLVAFLTGFSPLWLIILFLCCCFMPISVIGAVSFSLALNGQGRNAGSASALLGFFSMFLGGDHDAGSRLLRHRYGDTYGGDYADRLCAGDDLLLYYDSPCPSGCLRTCYAYYV